MTDKISTFGLTDPEEIKKEMEKTKPGNVKTAEFLRNKYETDKNKVYDSEIIGLRLTAWKEIEESCNGLRPGLYTIVAKSHVGKSTFILDLMLDVMISNKKKVVFYTLDDDKNETTTMMISKLSRVEKYLIEQKIRNPEKKAAVKKQYEIMAQWADSDFFVMKDFEEIQHIDELVVDIEEEKPAAVFIDGFMNIEANSQDTRKSHIERANKIMRLANKLNIPIVATTETPKTAPLRVKKEHIMESVKYAFNSKVCICLSHLDKKQKEKSSNKKSDEEEAISYMLPDICDTLPIINFEIEKNKYGVQKTFFRVLDGKVASFKKIKAEIGQDQQEIDNKLMEISKLADFEDLFKKG